MKVVFVSWVLIFCQLQMNVCGQSWLQAGSEINGESSGDNFGHSVSISNDGNRMAAGGLLNDGSGNNAGHVRVYAFNGQNWAQLGGDINGESTGDNSGYSVSLSGSGSRVAIGALFNNCPSSNSGHVRVYGYSGSSWGQLGADLCGSDNDDEFGHSVSLSGSGSRLAVGAPFNDDAGGNTGQVQVFDYGGTWTQIGNDIGGTGWDDNAGFSVSLSDDGTRLAIGSPMNDNPGTNSGQVRVYTYSNGSWNQLGNDISGSNSGDQLGYSVSLSSDGNRLAVGIPLNDNPGSNSGKVKVFNYSGGSWSPLGNAIDDGVSGDNFGHSVNISDNGNYLAVGSPLNDTPGSNSGQVRVYNYSSGTWGLIGQTIEGEASGDNFGQSVSLSASGTRLGVGAQLNDIPGSNSGQVRIYGLGAFTEIVEEDREFVLTIYPNPTTGHLEIIHERIGRPVKYSLYNNLGTLILAGESNDASMILNLSDHPSGIYCLEISTALLGRKLIKVIKVDQGN